MDVSHSNFLGNLITYGLISSLQFQVSYINASRKAPHPSVKHICISEIGYHRFRLWLVTRSYDVMRNEPGYKLRWIRNSNIVIASWMLYPYIKVFPSNQRAINNARESWFIIIKEVIQEMTDRNDACYYVEKQHPFLWPNCVHSWGSIFMKRFKKRKTTTPCATKIKPLTIPSFWTTVMKLLYLNRRLACCHSIHLYHTDCKVRGPRPLRWLCVTYANLCLTLYIIAQVGASC